MEKEKELFDGVKRLAKQGLSIKEISTQLGFKTPFTFQSKLIEASQILGKPVPIYKKSKSGGTGAIIDKVTVKKSKGDKLRLSIPHEPIARAGIAADVVMSVKVLKNRIILTAAQ